jgi:hypothetical protein
LPLVDPAGDTGTPRTLLPQGSREWCYRTVQRLGWAIEKGRIYAQEYEGVLSELVEHRAWEKLPTPEQHYQDLDDLLKHEIGVTQEEGRAKLGKRGRPKGRLSQFTNKGAIAPLLVKQRGGSDAEYLLARIRRDHKDIASRYDSGEFKSVFAAAKEAGITRTASIHLHILDPARAAKQIRRYFQGDALAALIRLLSEP